MSIYFQNIDFSQIFSNIGTFIMDKFNMCYNYLSTFDTFQFIGIIVILAILDSVLIYLYRITIVPRFIWHIVNLIADVATVIVVICFLLKIIN